MKKLLPLALLAVVLVAADKPAEKKADKERLQGTWAPAAVEADGNEVKDEKTLEALKKGTVTFRGDKFINALAPDRAVTFSIDPDKGALDLEVSEQGVKAVFRQLYQLVDDDTLRLCSGKAGDVRPKEFTSKDGQAIITYKREKQSDK